MLYRYCKNKIGFIISLGELVMVEDQYVKLHFISTVNSCSTKDVGIDQDCHTQSEGKLDKPCLLNGL